jgi:Putative beta-barrel porin 2
MKIFINIQIIIKRNLGIKELFSKASQIVFSFMLLIIFCSSGFAADGITWGRLWFKPELGLLEKYSDNIYLDSDSDNAKEDYITTILPKLSGRLAFTPDSKLELTYRGNFNHHTNFDNFGNSNQGDIGWSLYMPAGSNIRIGARVFDTAIQPYYESDREKPYLTKTAFMDTLLKLGSFNEIGMRYEYRVKQFDNSLDEEDNYDLNEFNIDYVNRYFPRFPVLLEYRYGIKQAEYNPSANSRSNAIYIGARWTPETRLSGNLRIGYQYTDYDDIDDVSLIVVDTSLSYKLSDMTTVRLNAIRKLQDSVRADIREVGNNYTFSILEGHFLYRFSDPLKLSLRLSYEKKDYDIEEEREDNLYGTRLEMDYSINRWFDLRLSYSYRINASTLETFEYRENAVYGGVKFSI